EKGAGDSPNGARSLPSAGGTGLPPALVKPVMDRRAPPTEEHAGMLDRFVGVKQPRTDGANFGAVEQPSQDVVPPLGKHYDIVIAKEQERQFNGGKGPGC